MELFWLLQALAFFAMLVLLVPPFYMKKLLLFVVLGGFLYTLFVQHVAVNVLKLWRFQPDFLTLWNIPIFFVLAWFAVTWIYGYLLFYYPKQQLWIFTFFVLKALALQIVAVSGNHISYIHWSTANTFLFAIVSHIFLIYLLKVLYRVDQLGVHEDLVGYSLSLLKHRH